MKVRRHAGVDFTAGPPDTRSMRKNTPTHSFEYTFDHFPVFETRMPTALSPPFDPIPSR